MAARAAGIEEGKGDAMLALDHLGRRIQLERLGVAAKVGDGDIKVERLRLGKERRTARLPIHRIERVENEVREIRPAEGWREPFRADEIGELRADLGPVLRFDGLVDRPGALGKGPGDRHRGGFGEARDAADLGIEQLVDIGGSQPQIRQRLDRAPLGDGVREEDGVDPAGARPGQDVDIDAQVQVAAFADRPQKIAIGPALGRFIVRMEQLARLGGAPDLLGDAVHVDGEADAAVADERDPKLFLTHRGGAWQDDAGLSSASAAPGEGPLSLSLWRG